MKEFLHLSAYAAIFVAVVSLFIDDLSGLFPKANKRIVSASIKIIAAFIAVAVLLVDYFSQGIIQQKEVSNIVTWGTYGTVAFIVFVAIYSLIRLNNTK